MNTETAIIDRLDALISAMKSSSIPSDRRLWDAETIAAYLGVSVPTVLNRYAPRHDFPAALRLPTAGSRGTARWNSGEIMEWAAAWRERKRA
jgi:predicted DNA-binding transcriptional regulator AlpA